MEPEQPEWLTRMKVEYAGLDQRIDKLDKFIGYDPAYQDLHATHRGLLMIQRDAMRTYASCLSLRLELTEKADA